MPGKAPRRKGDTGERELVELLRSMGYSARRVPLSGAVATFKGDVLVGEKCPNCLVPAEPEPCVFCGGTGVTAGTEEQWEVKRRAGAFKLIDRWLDDAYAVAYRRDRGEWIVTMRLKDLPKR